MNKKRITLILIITVFIISFFHIRYISKKMNKGILNYSEVEAKRIATNLINISMKTITDKKDIDEKILTITKNSKDEIQLIDFNTKEVNKILKNITDEVGNNILKLENGDNSILQVGDSLKGTSFKHIRKGIVCELKGGGIFGESLFANVGPSIPIKLSFIGEVLTSLKTDIKSYGLNNVYLEVDVEIKLTERITVPLLTKDIIIKKQIPIAIKVIQGNIPNYYNEILEKNSSSYTLPLDE